MLKYFIWKNQAWHLCLGFQGEKPIDLKITCPDQSTVPGYSTTPPPSTVSATVIATTAETTMTTKSQGSDSEIATRVATTTTMKSEGSNSGLATDSGDEKGLGEIILMFLSFPCLRFCII